MPRINIEDSLYKDDRFINLMLKVGGKWTAIGMVVSAWTLAQRHYLDESNDRCIPFNDWERSNLGIIQEVGLAEIREKGVYVCGSEQQFGWLVQRSEAGKKSAESKNKKSGGQRSSAVVQRNATKANGSQPLPLTPSLPQEELNTTYLIGDSTNQPPATKVNINLKAKEVIAAYCLAFKDRYSGSTPTIDPKDIGQLQRLCKVYSGGRLVNLVQVYVQMKDPFFEKRKHDLGTFIQNINKVGVAMQTGIDDGASDLEKFMHSDDNKKAVTA